MKKVIFYISLVSTIFANPLQNVDTSFSISTQKSFLNLLSHNSLKNQHLENSYHIKKGWNIFVSPKNGIDVIETFKDKRDIKFVVTYDKDSDYWAGFTLYQYILKDLKKMLLLKYLEPNKIFFILSDRDLTIDVKFTKIDKSCQKIIDTHKYNLILDSGLDGATIDRDIGIQSRYHSHEYRGFYDDTRVLLIYEKGKDDLNITQQYGLAQPTVILKYSKEYEDKEFYIFDYLQRKCYRGFFPSKKIPPFPALESI